MNFWIYCDEMPRNENFQSDQFTIDETNTNIVLLLTAASVFFCFKIIHLFGNNIKTAENVQSGERTDKKKQKKNRRERKKCVIVGVNS